MANIVSRTLARITNTFAESSPTSSRGELTRETMKVGGPMSFFARGGKRDEWDPPDRVIERSVLGYRLYQRMLDDPYIESALNQKKARVLAPGWSVIAPNGDEASIRNRSFAAQQIKDLEGGDESTFIQMLDASDAGHSISEITYELVKHGEFAGKFGWKHIKTKDPESIGLHLDDFNNLLGLKSRADETKIFRIDKFFIFSLSPRYASPWGRSDLRTAFRPWFIKRVIIKLQALNAERKTTPIVIAKVDSGTPDTVREAIMETLEELQHNSFLVVDNDLEYEIHDLLGKAGGEYRMIIDQCNKDIVIGILGSFLAMMEGSKTGSRNAGEMHADVTTLFCRAIGRKFGSDFTAQAIKQLIRLNWDDGAIPELRFNNDDGEAVEDMRSTDEFLLKAGVALSRADLYERYNRPAPKDEEDTILNPVGIVGGGGGFSQDPLLEAPDENAQFAEGKFWRKPNTFEEKNRIRSMDAFLQKHQTATVEAMGPAYDKMFAQAAEQIKRAYGKSATLDPKKVNIKISQKSIETVLSRSAFVAAARGYADVIDIVRREKLSTKARKLGLKFKRDATPLRLERLEEETFQEPWDIIGPAPQTQAVEILKGLVPIEAKSFTALTSIIKRASIMPMFTVAGLERAAIEREVQAIMVQAVQNGWGFDKFFSALQQAKTKYSLPIFGKAGLVGEKILDFHAENVFRTNVMRSYNDGRAAGHDDPVVSQMLPGKQWSSILDDRTTDHCERWDGFTAPANDPIWEEKVAPAHYMCRAVIIAIDFEDWSPEIASKTVPPIQSQKGFGTTAGASFR